MEIKKKIPRTENGQSMVEFAVSGIIIIILLVAVMDLGRAFFTYIALRDAAQEGAFYASICPADINGIETRALESSNKPVDLKNDPGVEVECFFTVGGGAEQSCSSGLAAGLAPGQDMVRIVVWYNEFQITTPLLGGMLGTQTMHLRADASDHILREVTVPPTDPCP